MAVPDLQQLVAPQRSRRITVLLPDGDVFHLLVFLRETVSRPLKTDAQSWIDVDVCEMPGSMNTRRRTVFPVFGRSDVLQTTVHGPNRKHSIWSHG